MKENQKIRSVFISLVLAIIALFLMEKTGISYGVSSHFFGDIGDMGIFKTWFEKDWYEAIRAIIILLFIVYVMYCAFFVGVFFVFSLTYFIVKSKFRKPSVFISHKHSREGALVNTSKIALELKAILEAQNFQVCFFKYTEALHHDNVNHEIRDLLRQSDCMVVIPDPYNPSYVNTEIQCAAYDYKPVYIIKHTADQKLPDTANSGHPVFLLEKLSKTNFEPLIKTLCFVHNHWKNQINILMHALLLPFFFKQYFDDEDEFYVIKILILALTSVAFVYLCVPLDYILWSIKAIIIGLSLLASYSALETIFNKSNLQEAVNQSIVTGGETFELFQKSDIDADVLDALDKKGLKIN